MNAPRVLGIDADDTLWHSEVLFADVEERFVDLMAPHAPGEGAHALLLATERRNLELFGYGVKGFTLSMIETAIELTGGRLSSTDVSTIVDWGKQMLAHPVDLIDGVEETVRDLHLGYRLVLITKGDLFHQESKVARSGLAGYFDAVEIVGEKDEDTYARVLRRHGVEAAEFCMVGNSVRSDVLPVLAIGGQAVHIPYGVLSGLEAVEPGAPSAAYTTLEALTCLPSLLTGLR